MALISLSHVSKVYPKGTRPALDDVNLDIERGDFVFLVGASGSGKTTLLSLLLREEEATGGEIRVAGNDLRRISNRQVPQYRRSIGFVFQDYKLLNNKTVWQNVAFALEVIGTRRSTIKSLVPKVLQTVGLTGKEHNYPHELSGGEQQRVAIARAYVNHPQILLADEPTGNLDPTTSLGIMEVLDAINRTGTTIVMATHNEEIVNSMRKRVVELHTGRIVRDEEHGSYDSAVFFPDAAVESKAHQALGTDARFRPQAVGDGGEVEVDAAAAIEAGSAASGLMDAHTAMGVDGDEGIARLAQSVHSGRTGRYGEAFAPVETTLTWGRGLNLEELAKAKEQAEPQTAGKETSAADASEGTGDPDQSASPHTGVDAAGPDGRSEHVAPADQDAAGTDGRDDADRDEPARDTHDEAARERRSQEPPAPPASPASSTSQEKNTDDTAKHAGEGLLTPPAPPSFAAGARVGVDGGQHTDTMQNKGETR
ncbi:cell division ATP-binding protein FtsE [Bifidobacterium saguinibicoloris]|uniref:cell division ATP-binding protein FtsE n=1 Tax=Bifidobacterium saguinibicoloris TaxID=2834433 RepID=UPI001C56DBFE|nr:cell division ATP-binding protein FtsE [Bifidobacterium saguinibicoloris]